MTGINGIKMGVWSFKFLQTSTVYSLVFEIIPPFDDLLVGIAQAKCHYAVCWNVCTCPSEKKLCLVLKARKRNIVL